MLPPDLHPWTGPRLGEEDWAGRQQDGDRALPLSRHGLPAPTAAAFLGGPRGGGGGGVDAKQMAGWAGPRPEAGLAAGTPVRKPSAAA